MTYHVEWFIAKLIPASSKYPKKGFIPAIYKVWNGPRKPKKIGSEIIADYMGICPVTSLGLCFGAITLDKRLGEVENTIKSIRSHKLGYFVSLGDTDKTINTTLKTSIQKILAEHGVPFKTIGTVKAKTFGKEIWQIFEILNAIGSSWPGVYPDTKIETLPKGVEDMLIYRLTEMGWKGSYSRSWNLNQLVDSLLTSGFRKIDFDKKFMGHPAAKFSDTKQIGGGLGGEF